MIPWALFQHICYIVKMKTVSIVYNIHKQFKINKHLTHCHGVCQHNLWLSSVITDDTVYKGKQVSLKISSFFLSLKICHFNRYFSLKRHLSFLFCTLYEKMKSTDACTLEAFFPSSYMFIEENCSCTSIYKERNQLYVYTYIYIYKIEKSKSENDENVLCHQWSIHWPWVEVQIQ